MVSETSKDVSSSEAVLLGALSSGVNAPTWSTLKIVFILLGITLASMLALAFSSSDMMVIFHVLLLLIITGTLFVLLSRIPQVVFKLCSPENSGEFPRRMLFPTLPEPLLKKSPNTPFLAQTGLVSVDQQMQEMGISSKKDGERKEN
ncbi:uncharacterized protein LOC144706110 isoform X2 [Wolffia australiana]